MRKEAKGAVAATAAAALLVGGGGTLAYWSAEGNLSGASPSSGELKLLKQDCDGAGTGAGTGWFFDAGEALASKEYVAGDLLVPGDVLTKVCTWEIQATGQHLRATIGTAGAADSGDLAAHLDVATEFEIGTTAGVAGTTEITEGDDGEILTSTVTVTMPYGALDNSSQALAGALSDYVVTLTQVHG